MDRLTKWNGKKWVLPQGKTSDGESFFRIIAERLAEYENIGTPDEVKRKLEIIKRLEEKGWFDSM